MPSLKVGQRLEAGETLTGAFCPVGASFETPGILSWNSDGGAVLRLADLSDPWPRDFETRLTVHGVLHAGERVTLMHARVGEITALDKTSLLLSPLLALGAHTNLDDTWTWANYCPTGLHEWYPVKGFVHEHSEEDPPQPRVQMRPVDPLRIELPGAELLLQLNGVWTASHSPRFSFETTLKFSVRPEFPLTIDEHWSRYGNPLLGFVIFASDRPDDLSEETFYDPEGQRQIVVLRSDRRSYKREWRPLAGHFLFRSEDVPDEGEVIRRWVEVWRRSEPSLGLFCETIQQDTVYSPPRFLTLWTAAEGFWNATKRPDESRWNIPALVKRAGVDPAVSHVDRRARQLMGSLRSYHAHLTLPKSITTEDIALSTFDSTRRLHLLMQACLLRELGLPTPEIEALLQARYRSWPVP
jgi:hypothetical protein